MLMLRDGSKEPTATPPARPSCAGCTAPAALRPFWQLGICHQVFFDLWPTAVFLQAYMASNPDGLILTGKDGVHPEVTSSSRTAPEHSSKRHKKRRPEGAGAGSAAAAARCKDVAGFKPSDRIPEARFRQLMCLKYMSALAPPGEAVGVLAAQSIGGRDRQSERVIMRSCVLGRCRGGKGGIG
jgi:hypothetical protein